MKFSIIVPVYNTEEYLDNCILSIVSQDYMDYELILIDDGSTDESGDLCDLWAQKDDRIMVRHQNNQGSAAARNRGINCANGDYILFLDSDDWWTSKSFLTLLKNRIEKTKPDVLSYNFKKEYHGRYGREYFKAEDMPESFDKIQSVKYINENHLWIASSCNKVVRHTLLKQKKLYFPEKDLAEDIVWCAQLALSAKKFDYISDSSFVYRQRTDSLSKTITEEKILCVFEEIKEIQTLVDNGDLKEKEELLWDYFAYEVGSFMADVAQIRSPVITKMLEKEMIKWIPYICDSNEKKVHLVYVIASIFGIRGALAVLSVYYRIKKIYWGCGRKNLCVLKKNKFKTC